MQHLVNSHSFGKMDIVTQILS